MSSKETNYHIIRYVVKYVTSEDGIKEAVFSTKKVKKASVKRYMSDQHKLAQVSKCAEMLLRFLTEEMDLSNNICHSLNLRTNFLQHMKKDCGLEYNDDTVKKAFYSLVKVGLVISYGTKVDYTVNPLHYFKGTEKQRKEVITELLRLEKKANPKSNLKKALSL